MSGNRPRPRSRPTSRAGAGSTSSSTSPGARGFRDRRGHRRRPRPLGERHGARPGFERLVAGLCAGEVGAVLCFDASRLARNGRDWHHLLELCGLVEARVIDLGRGLRPLPAERPAAPGHEGQHQRVRARRAARPHARCRPRQGASRRAADRRAGRLRLASRGTASASIPDLRLQEAIRLIFARFRELGSARQVLLSLTADGLHFPRPSDGKRMTAFEWTPIRYRNVISRAEEPLLRRGLRLRQKREAHRRSSTAGPGKSYGHGKPLETVGGPDQGSPRGLHRLGRVRAEPGAARRQRLRPGRRREVRSRRAGAAVGHADLRALRPAPGGRLHGRAAGPPGLSLRPAQPDAGTAALPELRRLPRRRRHRRRRCFAPWSRWRSRRRWKRSGCTVERQAERRRIVELDLRQARYEAAPRGAPLRGLRSRQPPDRRAAREELGGRRCGAWRPARLAPRGAGRPGSRGSPSRTSPASPPISPPRGTRRASRCARASCCCGRWSPTSSPMSTRRRARSSLTIHWRGGQHSRPAGQEAEDGRARLPHARGGAGRDAEHGGALVGRGYRRLAQPHGHAHRAGQDLDGAPCRLDPQGPRASTPTARPRRTARGSR